MRVNAKSIAEDIIKEAKILKLPLAPSKEIANLVSVKIMAEVEKKSQKSPVTKDRLNAIIAKELKPFNRDLSFVYQNRGKII